jgi:hypothetical protein
MNRELWVTVPAQTEHHYLIKTELTNEELQLKLESVEGNFFKILGEFQILDSMPSDDEDYDDRNDTIITEGETNIIAYYNPNKAC